MRKAEVFLFGRLTGKIEESEDGRIQFAYSSDYIETPGAEPISPTMPLQTEPYWNEEMLPVFDGLIPEGWLLDIAEETWKLDPRDRFGLLLACCQSCIGAVSVREVNDGK